MPSSLLLTDGYKFSMAEAGWPLRKETFYYSHRKGGPQVMPVDAQAYIRAALPEPTQAQYDFLTAHDYDMGAGFKHAVRAHSELVVHAVPRGAVFYNGEPVFSVTGSSALVSWLEPLLLQLHYRIQVATLARFQPEALAQEVREVTCERQKEIVLETLDAVGVKAPPIAVITERYQERVRETAKALVAAVGNPDRIFEVGLRSVSCQEQHELALREVKAAGINRTSNVAAAAALDMIPIGTMGHEHIQRYGSDAGAFRSMRDRRPYRSSYLLDTYDTLQSGLPAAYALIAEEPNRGDSIRFDSGDKVAQARFAVARARELGLYPTLVLEDSLDVELTQELEAVREELRWLPERWFYGYGGFLVSRTAGSALTRDRVAAVYKVSQSGPFPTMKFGNEANRGKESHPGRPVVFRRVKGEGPVGIVGQEGEPTPEGYALLTGAPADVVREPLPEGAVVRSPQTQVLADALRAQHFGRGK